MRQLAAAKHVGKIVLQPPESRVPAQTGSRGRWIVTGGMGALGALAGALLLCLTFSFSASNSPPRGQNMILLMHCHKFVAFH